MTSLSNSFFPSYSYFILLAPKYSNLPADSQTVFYSLKLKSDTPKSRVCFFIGCEIWYNLLKEYASAFRACENEVQTRIFMCGKV